MVIELIGKLKRLHREFGGVRENEEDVHRLQFIMGFRRAI